jgi:hypothetical protein
MDLDTTMLEQQLEKPQTKYSQPEQSMGMVPS